MSQTHFKRVREVATDTVSVNRVVCRIHPEEALVVKERIERAEMRSIVLQCPACMRVAHSHEDRERCRMTLSTEPHSADAAQYSFADIDPRVRCAQD